jgi:integrase
MTKTANPDAYVKYRNVFKRAMEEWGAEKLADEITPQDIINYKTKYEKKFAPGTMRNEMKRLKSLFNFAFNSGYLSKQPFSGLRFAFKEEDKPFLTYEEIEAIRAAKLGEKLDRVRNFFLFLCFSGLEYADIVELTKEDVKTNKYGQLYIKKKRIKTGEEYISILYEDAEELWKLFGGDIPVISNQRSNAYLKEIATAAGIDKTITTLTARHTYATYLLSKRQMPIEVVQKMLGHTTPTQSLHYAKMLDDSVFLAAHQRRGAVQSPEPTRQDMEDIEYFNRILGLTGE